MKKLLISFFILGNIATHSQSHDKEPLKYKDALELQEINKPLSNKEFNAIIQTSFSKLITGQTANNVGSYASVDIEKTEVTFSPTFIMKNGNIITGKLMGGISDGAYAIFNNSKLNTNISLEVQYHFLFNDKPKRLYYYLSDYDKQKDEDTKIKKEYMKDSTRIANSLDYHDRILENDNLKTVNKTFESEIKTLEEYKKLLEEKLKKTIISTDIELLNSKLELLTAQLESKKFKKEQNQIKIAENNLLNKKYDESEEWFKIGNTRADKEKVNDISKLKLAGYQFSWISLSYKLKNDEFRLLNSKEIYENQITKDNYISHEFKTQYSYVHLNQGNDKTTYFTSSLTIKYKNNFKESGGNTNQLYWNKFKSNKRNS